MNAIALTVLITPCLMLVGSYRHSEIACNVALSELAAVIRSEGESTSSKGWTCGYPRALQTYKAKIQCLR